MPRYCLDLECDGRAWRGTAIQAEAAGPTLQGVLRAALAGLDGGPVMTRTASRLDAGVSASSLPTHCDLRRSWLPHRLGTALNARLPACLRVLRVAAVADDWDARFRSVAKTYTYRCLIRPVAPTLDQALWWMRRLFHPEHLPGLAQALIGRHDLSAFACHRNDGNDPDDPVRTVHQAQWTVAAWPGAGRLYRFRITGSGFLYRQVRGLVGGMIAVARGEAAPQDFLDRVGGRPGPRIGSVAPSEGLLLERLYYDPEPDWVALG